MLETEVNLLRVAIFAGLFVGLTACQGSGDQQSPEPSLMEDTQAVTHEKYKQAEQMNLSAQIKFSRKNLASKGSGG